MIQRWQSLYLFLASLLMGIYAFTPTALITRADSLIELSPMAVPVYFVLNVLTAILLFVAIFFYKNVQMLKTQKRLTVISMLLIVCSAICGALILYGPMAIDGDVAINWSAALLIASFFFAVAACRGIKKDIKILNSYDRIR